MKSKIAENMVLGYFPNLQPIHLSKCVGQIPYWISKKHNVKCVLISDLIIDDIDDFQDTLDKFMPGAIVYNLKPHKILGKNIAIFGFILKNAKQIKLLFLYQFGFHFNIRSMLYSLFYKILNPAGKLYVRLEADYKHLDVNSKLPDNYFTRKIAILYLQNIDYLGTLDLPDFRNLLRFSLINRYVKKSSFFCLPNGFNAHYLKSYIPNDDFISFKENIIILTGRHDDPYKGLSIFLSALRGLDLKDWRVVICGADAELINQRVRKIISDENLIDRISVLGFVEYDELYDRLKKSKLYVLPSYIDGIPLAAVEAMAFGNVLISSDHFGMKYATEFGAVGRIFPPGSSFELQMHLDELINHPEEIERLGKLTFEKAWGELSWEKIVGKIEL